MRTFKLTIAYDGSQFAGWQSQPGKRTVQQTIEEALALASIDSRYFTGSSRTDSGVHAIGQVVSFDSTWRHDAATMLRAINVNLPYDVVVVDADVAWQGFHARRHAIGKRYRYQIHNSRIRSVIGRGEAWHIPQKLDLDRMRRAAQSLIGRHDFKSFQSTGAERVLTVRTVHELSISGRPDGVGAQRVTIDVAANGFLYNMVRTIVGTLVEVGRGVQSETWPAEVLACVDRRSAGPTAPAQGLCLLSVEFPIRAPQVDLAAEKGPGTAGEGGDMSFDSELTELE